MKPTLLSPIYYIKKSLDTRHFVKVLEIEDTIEKTYSTIIIPENVKITNKLDQNLNKWLFDGGTLIRFAGEGLAGKISSFLPYEEAFSSIRYIDGQLTINNKLFVINLFFFNNHAYSSTAI